MASPKTSKPAIPAKKAKIIKGPATPDTTTSLSSQIAEFNATLKKAKSF